MFQWHIERQLGDDPILQQWIVCWWRRSNHRERSRRGLWSASSPSMKKEIVKGMAVGNKNEKEHGAMANDGTINGSHQTGWLVWFGFGYGAWPGSCGNVISGANRRRGPMKSIVIAGEPLVIAVAGWTCKRTTTSTTSCIAYHGTRQGHWRVALIFLIPEVEIFWFPAAMLDDVTSRRWSWNMFDNAMNRIYFETGNLECKINIHRMNEGHFWNYLRRWGTFAIILKKGGIFAICPCFQNINTFGGIS